MAAQRGRIRTIASVNIIVFYVDPSRGVKGMEVGQPLVVKYVLRMFGIF